MKKFNSITAILVCIAFVVQLQAQPDVMPEIENVLKEGQKSLTF
jgi:hypothetical protein